MKKNIALVTGGFSGEAVISYKSAVTIDNNLDRNYFNVYKIDINSQGWFYELIDGRKIEIDKNDFSLVIYDRFGMLVFETDKFDPKVGCEACSDGAWDGTYKGNKASA